MALPTQTFAQFLINMQNAVLTATTKITNLTDGSIAQAICKSVTGMAISLQQLIVHVYNTNRLATSYGVDVDSFVGDFTLQRLTQTYATGTLTLTRATSGVELVVPLGFVVQTPILRVQFVGIADTTQLSFDPVRNVYFFMPTQYSINVTVQAGLNFGGVVGNIAQNALTQIVSGLRGVNTCTNSIAYADGRPQETDPAVKSRFVTFLGSLRSADRLATQSAIQSVSPNLSYQILEYQHFDGSPFVAGFCIVVDDGTGKAGSPFLNAVYKAVDNIRAAGVQFEVFPPSNMLVSASVHINVVTGGSLALVQNNVVSAIQVYINTLGVGVIVAFGNVSNVIQNTPGVFSYSNLLLNGSNADVNIALTQIAETGAITFS